jgi:hypothetical protein
MATILEFRAGCVRGSHSARLQGSSAEIVIFPGIRYERWKEGETPAPAQPKIKRQRHRDTLELED